MVLHLYAKSQLLQHAKTQYMMLKSGGETVSRSSATIRSSEMSQNDGAAARNLQHKWKNLNVCNIQIKVMQTLDGGMGMIPK